MKLTIVVLFGLISLGSCVGLGIFDVGSDLDELNYLQEPLEKSLVENSEEDISDEVSFNMVKPKQTKRVPPKREKTPKYVLVPVHPNKISYVYPDGKVVTKKIAKKSVKPERKYDIVLTDGTVMTTLPKDQDFESPEVPEKPKLPIVPRNTDGMWIWTLNPQHYLITKDHTDQWKEYVGDELKFTYTVHSYSGDDIILYDPSQPMYLKLSPTKIATGSTFSAMRSGRFSAPGSWKVQPKPVDAKWVWKINPTHYLENEKDTTRWIEYSDGEPVAKYILRTIQDGLYPILFNSMGSPNFALVTDDTIFLSNNFEKLKSSNLKAPGKWLKTPKFRV